MKIKDIGRKLGDIVLMVPTSGCGCAGGCGGCGARANPLTVEPANEREGSESKESRGLGLCREDCSQAGGQYLLRLINSL